VADDQNLVQWSNADPRDTIYKRANIIILRPNTQGQFGNEVGEGWVETKEGYHIHTTFEDHRNISADDKWDPIWWWVMGPAKT
jgi:hypothetical protein